MQLTCRYSKIPYSSHIPTLTSNILFMEHGDLAINRPSRLSRVESGYKFSNSDLRRLGETVWSNKSHHASSVGDFAASDIQLSEPCQKRQEQLTAMGFTTKKNKV